MSTHFINLKAGEIIPLQTVEDCLKTHPFKCCLPQAAEAQDFRMIELTEPTGFSCNSEGGRVWLPPHTIALYSKKPVIW